MNFQESFGKHKQAFLEISLLERKSRTYPIDDQKIKDKEFVEIKLEPTHSEVFFAFVQAVPAAVNDVVQ